MTNLQVERCGNELALRISSIKVSGGKLMSRTKDVLTVTFDSNVLIRVLQPENVQNLCAADIEDLKMVNEAIRTGMIEGFVAKTFFTKEAVPKVHREDVYRKAFSRYKEITSQSTDARLNNHNLKIRPIKKHQFDSERLFSRRNFLPVLRQYHVRILHTYLCGDILPQLKNGESIEDVFSIDDFYHWDGDEGEVMNRNDLCFRFIVEDLKAGALCVDVIDDIDNAHDEISNLKAKIGKSAAEEADVQAIATHYAHQIDIFCTEDKGKSAGGNSVMKAENKAELTKKFGIRFCTLSELTRLIEKRNVSAMLSK